MLATIHLDRVQSVSFIGSPVGVSSPIPSDMETAIANGSTPLAVQDHDWQPRCHPPTTLGHNV
ncbi:MAG: hypothetical protein AAFZ38_10280 [Myxococcota bacterium]